MMRLVLVSIGMVALGLGITGVFLPLLPTTPFLLLAAACFAKASPRLHSRLMNSRWLGSYISDYQAGRGITLGTKRITLTLLWASIGYSAIMVVVNPLLRLLLLLIAIAVTWHVTSLPTRSEVNPLMDDPSQEQGEM